MDRLMCVEPIGECARARRDHALLSDSRVLKNLLDLQKRYVPKEDYFKCVQPEMQSHMRRVLTSWMLEVCEAMDCEEQVFPLAVNYLDRFLCECPIDKTQLQLLGCVCLLIASKLRQCRVVTSEQLAYYTANSVTQDDIRNWEVLVLAKLSWDVNSITALDFIEPLLHYLDLSLDMRDKVADHTHILLSVISTEAEFMMRTPSLLSCACISSSMEGLGGALHPVVKRLSELTGEPAALLFQLVHRIENLIRQKHQSHQQQQQTPNHNASDAVMNKMQAEAHHHMSSDSESYGQPETPTDVSDIYFD